MKTSHQADGERIAELGFQDSLYEEGAPFKLCLGGVFR